MKIEGNLKCPQCSGICKQTELNVEGLKVNGWRCENCSYEIISPEEVEKAHLYLQARKIEKVKISKRGNSYMITIPKKILNAVKIKKFANVYLENEDTIVVKV